MLSEDFGTDQRSLDRSHAELVRRLKRLSRSAFAERFTRAIGEPPMRYLARQRFEQASAQLKDTTDPIARIAYDVGYESEEAFNRAFRREYGAPPAAWRRANAAGRIQSPRGVGRVEPRRA